MIAMTPSKDRYLQQSQLPWIGEFESLFPESVKLEWDHSKDKMKRLSRLLLNPPDVEVGTTPSEVVYSENKLRLIHYRPMVDNPHPVPVVLVYALINRPYILDLQPDRSVVRRMLEEGLDVYLIDWGVPSGRDRFLTLHDYINGYMDRVVDFVRDDTGQDQVTVFGYCMGGTMSIMYTALHPDKVKNLVVMAAGIDFSTDAGLLHVWSRENVFDVDKMVDTYGNITPDFLNGGYDFLDPVGNFYTKYLTLLDRIDDPQFVEMFFRMEKWVKDGIPLAGETFRDFLKYGYQQNLLAKNQFPVNHVKVNLQNVSCPLLTIIGTYDHLVPAEATRPLPELVASGDRETMEIPTGHIGLSVSSKSHRNLWPQATEWIAARSHGGPSGRPASGDEPGKATGPVDDPPKVAVEDKKTQEPETPKVRAKATSDPGGEDDLTRIPGVGPATARKLLDKGIGTVEEVAESSIKNLVKATGAAEANIRKWVKWAKDTRK